jgi:hypothetical protein
MLRGLLCKNKCVLRLTYFCLLENADVVAMLLFLGLRLLRAANRIVYAPRC